MLVWVKCWKCELCGHRWVAVDLLKPPDKCAKCRRRGWNATGTDYTADAGRAPELPAAEVQPVAPAVPPASSLDGLKARLGLVPAAALLGPPVALDLPEVPTEPPATEPARLRRDFNPRRRGWYAPVPVPGCEWAELLKDRETGQVWLIASGGATEYPTEEEARAALDI